MDTKHVTDAVVDGVKQGTADRAAKQLLTQVKKLAGDNYPAIFSTQLGQAVEPVVIPAVVSVIAGLVAEFLIAKKKSPSVTATNVRESQAKNNLSPEYKPAYRLLQVMDVADVALTHAIADLTSSELNELIGTVVMLGESLFPTPEVTTV